MRIIFALLCFFLSVIPASAEWAIDLYGGYAETQKTDVTETSSLTPVTLTLKNIKFDGSGTGGGRLGYWFPISDIASFGLGLDAFYFEANVGQQTVPAQLGNLSGNARLNSLKSSVVGIGFDLAKMRLHLARSEQFPNGQVQPYVSVGPALFVATVKDSTTFTPNNQSDTDTKVGLKVGGGVQFLITQNIGLFGEYRYTYFKTEASFRDTTPPPSTETLSTNVHTHHLIGGISFHF